MKKVHKDLHQEVTDKIIAELEKGAAPWVKPWRATAGRNNPANFATGRPYSGCNVLMLWIAMQNNGWSTPRFATFKQVKAAGGNVKGGEKSTEVYFVKQIVAKDKLDPDVLKRFGLLRMYHVFNIDQCENLPAKFTEVSEPKVHNPDQRDPLVEEFVAATKAKIVEGRGEAYFAPGPDYISMPAFESFKSADHFNNVRFHELGHYTGHKSRLNRDFDGRFGDQKYAAEELVAELCAAFLCAEFDINGDLRNAGYIETWLRLLKSDSKAIFTASAAAQKAVDFLRGLALAEEEDSLEKEAA